MSVATALVASAWAPAATSWRVWYSQTPTRLPANIAAMQKADGNPTKINEAFGSGYHALRIDSRESISDEPHDSTQRRFVVEIGWPWPCIRTNAPVLGQRLFLGKSDGSSLSVVDEPTYFDIIWRGLLGNFFAFGLPASAALALIRLLHRKDKLLATIACSLCISFWISIGLSWLVCFASVQRHVRSYTDYTQYRTSVGTADTPPLDWGSFYGSVERSFGYKRTRAIFYHGEMPQPDEDVRPALVRHSFYVGWPFYCLQTEIAPDRRRHEYFAWRIFQIPIRWRGLAANVFIFASTLLLMTWMPFIIRHFYRRQTGRCRFCGYRRTGLSRERACPECGRT